MKHAALPIADAALTPIRTNFEPVETNGSVPVPEIVMVGTWLWTSARGPVKRHKLVEVAKLTFDTVVVLLATIVAEPLNAAADEFATC